MEELFQSVIEYGRLVRANKLDGLKLWEDIKGLFSDKTTCSGAQWKIVRTINGVDTSDIHKIYNYVYNELGMDGEDSDDKSDHDLWSKKHFFLQLIRIVKKNPTFSLVRLAQIAYNIGQLSNHLDSDPLFEEKHTSYFYSNRLNEIGSYIDLDECEISEKEVKELTDQINEMNREIREREQTGGSDKYYKKYLKYKQKYLALAKKL